MAKQTKNLNRDVEEEVFIEATADHQIKHNHLLVIAVDHYEDDEISNLLNCVGDAEKLSHASGLALTINDDDIPFSGAVRSAIQKDPSCFETAISGGDDYEILFTVHPENVISVTERARSQGISLAEIGFAHPGEGVSVRDAEGRVVRLTRSGYNHSEQEQ